jgi:hypothetical protein
MQVDPTKADAPDTATVLRALADQVGEGGTFPDKITLMAVNERHYVGRIQLSGAEQYEGISLELP